MYVFFFKASWKSKRTHSLNWNILCYEYSCWMYAHIVIILWHSHLNGIPAQSIPSDSLFMDNFPLKNQNVPHNQLKLIIILDSSHLTKEGKGKEKSNIKIIKIKFTLLMDLSIWRMYHLNAHPIVWTANFCLP